MKIIMFMILLLIGCTLSPKAEIKLGKNWEQILATSTFIARRNFGVAVVDNNIIVIGGFIWKNNKEELVNDVWISRDEGYSWQEIKPNTDNPLITFPKRQSFATVIVGNDIYIIGGYSDTGVHLNDVWRSSDLGKTWIEIIENADFTPRYGHKAIFHDDHIYVIGGYDGNIYYNEVWTSKDFGKNWSKLSDGPFNMRHGFGVINYLGEILLLGGKNGEQLTDTWRTQEGMWYTQLNTPFNFFEHQIVTVKRDLFVIEQSNVWKSIDEANSWGKIIFKIPFEERTGYGLVNLGRKLILFGGRNPKTHKHLNDIWVSEYAEIK